MLKELVINRYQFRNRETIANELIEPEEEHGTENGYFAELEKMGFMIWKKI